MTTRFLLAASLVGLCGFSTQQSFAEPQRTGAVNLGLTVSRTWNTTSSNQSDFSYRSTSQSNSLQLGGNYLILGEHFHFGPSVTYSRYYGDYYQNTTLGFGGIAKFTLENIQETTGTLFATISARAIQSKGSFDDSHGSEIGTSVGYEHFLNQYVSLQNYVSWEKYTEKASDSISSSFEGETKVKRTSKQEGLSFNVGLGIYL